MGRRSQPRIQGMEHLGGGTTHAEPEGQEQKSSREKRGTQISGVRKKTPSLQVGRQL